MSLFVFFGCFELIPFLLPILDVDVDVLLYMPVLFDIVALAWILRRLVCWSCGNAVQHGINNYIEDKAFYRQKIYVALRFTSVFKCFFIWQIQLNPVGWMEIM